MRIAFVGKGGSGKTTTSSLFIRHLLHSNKPVLAIDADINQHLCDAIDVQDRPCKELGLYQKELKQLLAGENPLVKPEEMMKTTPPGRGSHIFTGIASLQEYLGDFISQHGSGAFMNVGEQTEDDVSIRCYHSKTGSVELILNHLVDGKDEYIVVDMTAGADAFASGLFDKFDVTVVVVEPTEKSVSVFQQYASQAKKLGVHIMAVGNKVLDEGDKEFLENKLGEDLLTTIPVSSVMRKFERGEKFVYSDISEELTSSLEEIKRHLDKQEKDWERYLQRSHEIHRKNAESWGNSSMGVDLTKQIDPNFSY
jgi:CO dehydrogenase maturation factor